MLLSFREDELNCPCPLENQQLLQDFHQLLNAHCGKKPFLCLQDLLLIVCSYERPGGGTHHDCCQGNLN